jgi:hypothetical protein
MRSSVRASFLGLSLACTASEPTPVATAPVAPAPEATAPSVVAPAPLAAVPPTAPTRAPTVDPARGQAVAAELEALRRLVRAQELAEAAPRFLALAAREPGNPRLHCEAGFVALEAGDRTAAAREIDEALRIFERWSGLPALRKPHAMCVYNRGLLALRSGDRAEAIARLEASLALRPNKTVQARLDEARALPSDIDDDVRRHEDDAPKTITRGAVTHGAPTRTAVIEHVLFDDEPDSAEQGCFHDAIVLVDAVAGETRVELVEACDQTVSIFADWANVDAITWVDAAGPLGPVAVVAASHGGRGDDGGITVESITTLHLFAVKDGRWTHGELPIEQDVESDCMNDFCDDPESKDDDAEDRRKPFRNAFRLSWRIEAGVLTTAIESQAGEVTLPELTPKPLASWLAPIVE